MKFLSLIQKGQNFNHLQNFIDLPVLIGKKKKERAIKTFFLTHYKS